VACILDTPCNPLANIFTLPCTKFAHISSFERVPSFGIIRQLRFEYIAAQRLNIKWEPILLVAGKPIDLFSAKLTQTYTYRAVFYKFLWGWLISRARVTQYLLKHRRTWDIIVFRYRVHDPFLIVLGLAFRGRIIFIHHAIETLELQSDGFAGRVRAILDQTIGPIILSMSLAHVGVTGEIVDYEKSRSFFSRHKRTHVYPNGIIDVAPVSDQRSVGERKKFMFVCSHFDRITGLDLLLDNLEHTNNYVDDILIHLVGRIDAHHTRRIDSLSRYLVCHGPQGESYIRNLASRTWLSLGAFGLHRKGLTEGSTLKVRESLAMGLPVYSGHNDIFPIDFKHYLVGPPDLSSMVAFALRQRVFSREFIANASMPFIIKSASLGSFVKWIDSQLLLR